VGRINRGGGDGGEPARSPPSRDYPLGQSRENSLASEPKRMTFRKGASVHQSILARTNCSEFNGLEESFDTLD